jgi:pimeloyl-ACP methyl ester carboxylesterase
LINNLKPLSFDEVKGSWHGKLSANGKEILVIFNFNTIGDDELFCNINIPEQGVTTAYCEEVTFKDGLLRGSLKPFEASFAGHIDKDGSIIGCWRQNGKIFPLHLIRNNDFPTPYRSQVPLKPYPYEEIMVTYKNEKANITLTGTLTLPFNEGPFPAVMLLPGSDLYDRNYTYQSHSPFLILADYLTTKGIATLRIDSRGVGGSTGEPILPSLTDLADDAKCGINYLSQCTKIDAQKIGIIGHSGGAIVADIVATSSPQKVAFIIRLAGPGISSQEILCQQVRGLFTPIFEKVEIECRIKEKLGQIFDIIVGEKENNQAIDKINQIINEMEPSDLSLNMGEQEFRNVKLSLLSIFCDLAKISWARSFLLHNCQEVIKRIHCPVLALNGECDRQVSSKENLNVIALSLSEGQNKFFKVLEMPKLNHMFQTDYSGGQKNYGEIEETISYSVLKIIADWIVTLT